MRTNQPEYAHIPDEELVSRAQEGDNSAFSELVERHQATVKRLALSILHDQQDADDEVQNALWKAYEHLSGFNQDAKFSTWLSRIVVNQCLMRLRKTKRANLMYLEDITVGEDSLKLEVADQRSTPEEVLAQAEVGLVLQTEIGKLPPLMRDVLVLRDVSELPMPDVATRLGISMAAAKSRLLRARLEMRERMGKHLGRLGTATQGA